MFHTCLLIYHPRFLQDLMVALAISMPLPFDVRADPFFRAHASSCPLDSCVLTAHTQVLSFWHPAGWDQCVCPVSGASGSSPNAFHAVANTSSITAMDEMHKRIVPSTSMRIPGPIFIAIYDPPQRLPFPSPILSELKLSSW